MPITEALADYFDNATPGDLLKSHDRFAVFSQDKRWVGDLTAIRPGEGYFFRRMGQGDVVMHYYNKASSAAPKKVRNKSDYSEYSDYSDYHNPNAATNMTMIAKVVNVSKRSQVESLRAYVGDELAGIATPQVIGSDTLYFLTIQSDNQGELHFEMNGQTLSIVSESHSDNQIRYAANAHHGSLKAPVLLIPAGDTLAYPQKRIIDGILYIFSTDGRVYDAQGKLVDNPLK